MAITRRFFPFACSFLPDKGVGTYDQAGSSGAVYFTAPEFFCLIGQARVELTHIDADSGQLLSGDLASLVLGEQTLFN